MQNQPSPIKLKYYTVHLDIDGKHMPYLIYAASEDHAVMRARVETGYMAYRHDAFRTQPESRV